MTENLPTEEQLLWLKGNNYALVVGSPTEMNLIDIRSAKSSLFCSKNNKWYDDQPFAIKEKVGHNWLAISKDPVANSLKQIRNTQQKPLLSVGQIRNAAEISWFIATYYDVRGVQLFSNIYVRTSSVVANSRSVFVDDIDGAGIGVSFGFGESYYHSLGVSASQGFGPGVSDISKKF